MVKISYIEKVNAKSPPDISYIFNTDSFVIRALAASFSQKLKLEEDWKKTYEYYNENPEEAKEYVNRVVEGYGHNILQEIGYDAIVFEISRFAALFLWRNINTPNETYGAGIETSFRIVEPTKCCDEVKEFYPECLEAYRECLRHGILPQDARYLIPMGATTRMLISANSRYCNKITKAAAQCPLPELQKISKRLKQIVKKIGCETDEKVPSKWELFGDSQEKDVSIDIFGKSNDPFSISLSAYIRGSLSMFAQLVRQRQLLCNIEPLSSIAKKGRFVIPPSFDEDVKKIYKEIAKKAHDNQMDLLRKKDPTFAYYLLMGQEATADVYAHSAGAFELSQARTCGTAQWEIRNFGTEVAKKLANLGYEKKVGPKCWREGIICTEPNTFKTKYNKCPVLSKRTSGEKLKLNEALELLKTEYEVFEVQIS